MIELKTHGGLVWSVERRFSQFHQLNEVRTFWRLYELVKRSLTFPPDRRF
jgi:hypothetical protein